MAIGYSWRSHFQQKRSLFDFLKPEQVDMGIEIERKYLVKKAKWQAYKEDISASGSKYSQGYISTVDATTVRLRTIDKQGYLTIKGKTVGHARPEFEYPVPLADAESMLQTLCTKPLIEKVRFKINYGHLIWEVDEFCGDNAGLIIAEVELSSEDQQIELPNWIDKEINDRRYFNSSLVKYPYNQWTDKPYG